MIISTTYTTESVTAGHPDKVCDQISDALLDAFLTQDPTSRVAIEAVGGHGLLVIIGEVTSKVNVDIAAVVVDMYRQCGYADKLEIIEQVVKQSPDIAQGVDSGGAGDQGIMYGYATNETPEYLPKGFIKAHALCARLTELREQGQVSWLGPDGKAQVTITNGRVSTVLVSCQHKDDIVVSEIQSIISKEVIVHCGINTDVEVLINPTGRFVQGGFAADSGLTGRKIMVDTYGGLISHGGGCFSGKDPSKVDRSGAYMARWVAKNIVANGLANECLVAVAYAIGRPEPVMVTVESDAGKSLEKYVIEKIDFRPAAIIERLDLLRPIYTPTARNGHFGHEEFPWEQVVSL